MVIKAPIRPDGRVFIDALNAVPEGDQPAPKHEAAGVAREGRAS